MPRSLLSGIAVLWLLVSSVVAPSAVAASTPEDAHELRLGFSAVGMPLGALRRTSGDAGYNTLSTAPAFGVAWSLDRVSTHSFVGLSPRLTFNVKASDHWQDGPAALLGDVLVRLGLATHLEQSVLLQGYLSPGVSVMRRPGRPVVVGAVAGAHVGVLTEVSPAAFWSIQIGYQLALQTTDGFSYLEVALGGGVRW
jgi:hypothetical protein